MRIPAHRNVEELHVEPPVHETTQARPDSRFGRDMITPSASVQKVEPVAWKGKHHEPQKVTVRVGNTLVRQQARDEVAHTTLVVILFRTTEKRHVTAAHRLVALPTGYSRKMPPTRAPRLVARPLRIPAASQPKTEVLSRPAHTYGPAGVASGGRAPTHGAGFETHRVSLRQALDIRTGVPARPHPHALPFAAVSHRTEETKARKDSPPTPAEFLSVGRPRSRNCHPGNRTNAPRKLHRVQLQVPVTVPVCPRGPASAGAPRSPPGRG
ncbi:unnamed protein product [Agarophyton chilense]